MNAKAPRRLIRLSERRLAFHPAGGKHRSSFKRVEIMRNWNWKKEFERYFFGGGELNLESEVDGEEGEKGGVMLRNDVTLREPPVTIGKMR